MSNEKRFHVHEFSRVTGYYFCVVDGTTREPFGAWTDQADAQAYADRENARINALVYDSTLPEEFSR